MEKTYLKDNTRNLSAFELAGASHTCAALRRLVDKIGGIDYVSGEPGLVPTDHFADRLKLLYDIHVVAARYGLLNENLDADPYGMFRTEGAVKDMTQNEVFLGGVYDRFTHTMPEWLQLEAEGRLGDDDRKVILFQYASHLNSNLHAIGNKFYCAFRTAEKEIKDLKRKPLLQRLFTKRQYPACEMLPGYDEKQMQDFDWNRMFDKSFGRVVGVDSLPKLNVPAALWEDLDSVLPKPASVSLTKTFNIAEQISDEKGHQEGDLSTTMAWFKGLSFEDLSLAFSFYRPDGEGKAPGFIENESDRNIIHKAYEDFLAAPFNDPGIEETLIREDLKRSFYDALNGVSRETLTKMESELKAAGLGMEPAVLKEGKATQRTVPEEVVSVRQEENQEAVKERLREDIDYECRRVLRSLINDDHNKMKASQFAPAQTMDGTVFQGFNGVRLNAELAAYGAETNIFLTSDEIKKLGVSVLPAQKDRFCTLEDGSRVWNLAQTSYRKTFPDHFREISEACQSPSMDDETYKGMKLFWEKDLEKDKINPDFAEKMNGVYAYLAATFTSNQTGTLDEALKKARIVYSVATLSMVSKMSDAPFNADVNAAKLPFADIDETRSFRKGSSMYPAYEVMRSAGEMVSAAEAKHPIFQKREGIDANAIIRHVNAEIRIRNERRMSQEESKSRGI